MIDHDKRYTGKIIHVDTEHGYGFITCPEIKFTRVFFHWQGLAPQTKFDKLVKGDKVEFNAREYEETGVRAIKIVKMEESNEVPATEL
jgi:cold shock CspA family protein